MAPRAVFVNPFLLEKQLIYDFLTGNNYPNSPHLQGCVKFSTQISRLLNFLFEFSRFDKEMVCAGFRVQVCLLLN